MPTLTASAHLGDLVKREFDANYCRETVTLHAGTDYPLGAVLGRITATGAYTLSPAASTAGLEGAEIACAVLLDAASAVGTDTSAVALVRGPVIVADSALVFAATITTTVAKSAKQDQLAAHGIVVRQAV
jgi:hypothetical protein